MAKPRGGGRPIDGRKRVDEETIVSIYATLWHLRFPREEVDLDCEWVDVLAQSVPAHIGTPTPGYGYESGDPYEAFLPPGCVEEEDEPFGTGI